MPKTIVVMGLPRSGTTWLGKIFDSHPRTFYSHEPDSVRRFRDVPLILTIGSESKYRSELVSQVRALQQVRSTRVVGKLPLFDKAYPNVRSRRARNAGFFVLKGISRLIADPVAPRFLVGSASDASHWVWKSIESTGRLGVLARSLPEAKFIFIVRHPCGVIASQLRGRETGQFGGIPAKENFGFYERLAETSQARARGIDLEAFRSMSPVERMAWRWALMNEKALRDTEPLDNCKTVRYEDLCRDPAAVSAALLDFAELPWDEQTERFVSLSTTKSQDAYYSVFKEPQVSAWRWKEQLPDDTITTIMSSIADTESARLYAES